MIPGAATSNPGLLGASRRSRCRGFLGLMKMRLNGLVAVAASVGYLVAGRVPELPTLVALALGSLLAACGTSAMNMALEADLDARMERTRMRPVPLGIVSAAEAGIFGAILALVGLALLLATTNGLATLVCAVTVALYVLVYTPLKTRTTFNTVVGAVPGALPPLIGWAAAVGDLPAGAWALFAIVFLWQFPHFMAIASIHREDYRRGGFLMLPVVDPSGLRTAHRAVSTALLLLPVSLLPAVLGVTAAPIYIPGVLALGLFYLAMAVRAGARRTQDSWRGLLRASFIHLTGLLLLLTAGALPN